jgi:hypothetical protein
MPKASSCVPGLLLPRHVIDAAAVPRALSLDAVFHKAPSACAVMVNPLCECLQEFLQEVAS